MKTLRAFLLLALGSLLCGGLPAMAQDPDRPGGRGDWGERARRFMNSMDSGRFIAYHELLNDGNLVVMARLKKISASKKKRISPQDAVFPGSVGRLGIGANIARAAARRGGSNYYHATGKTTLTVDSVLFGQPSDDRVKLQFPLQLEKTGNGDTRYLMLGESPSQIDNGQLGLWILTPMKKPRGTFSALRVVSHSEPKGTPPSAAAKFKKKQFDYYEVNARIRVLTDAVKVAQGFYENQKLKEAAAVLDAALKDQLKVKALDFEEEAKKLVGPYRRKVESMLKQVQEKISGKPPAPASKPPTPAPKPPAPAPKTDGPASNPDKGKSADGGEKVGG